MKQVGTTYVNPAELSSEVVVGKLIGRLNHCSELLSDVSKFLTKTKFLALPAPNQNEARTSKVQNLAFSLVPRYFRIPLL